MKNKVVYNACYGGFSVSRKAAERLAQLGAPGMAQELEQANNDPSTFGDYFGAYDVARHDRRLVQVVEELGKEASGMFARLEIIELNSNRYRIREYDGIESVEEPHTIDWTIIED